MRSVGVPDREQNTRVLKATMAQDEDPVDQVDVLIVGAGPAGLMMANWMSRWGVRTRIVDKRGTKVSDQVVSSFLEH